MTYSSKTFLCIYSNCAKHCFALAVQKCKTPYVQLLVIEAWFHIDKTTCVSLTTILLWCWMRQETVPAPGFCQHTRDNKRSVKCVISFWRSENCRAQSGIICSWQHTVEEKLKKGSRITDRESKVKVGSVRFRVRVREQEQAADFYRINIAGGGE